MDEEWGQSREDAKKEFYAPTKEQLVVAPPHLRGAALQRWLERDLIKAIGEEYIDKDGNQQPFLRATKKAKKQIIIPEKVHGNRHSQSEFTGKFPL
jgi:hypothetical protein